MSVHSLRPPVRDLVFHLYGRPLHPELFDVLALRRLRCEDYQVTLSITPSGHVVSWENRHVHLTEVTAAPDLPLPLARQLIARKLRGEQNDAFFCAGGVRYQCSFQVEVLAPEIFLHVHDEILADGAKEGLLHNFQPHHRLALAPLGCIAFEARRNWLSLATFHTFPDEHTIVKTQSLIERKE